MPTRISTSSQTVRGQHSQQNYLISRDMHNTRMYSNIDSPRYQNRGIPPANEMPNFSGNGEYRNLDSNSQFYGSSRVADLFSHQYVSDNSKIINTTITSNGSSNNANMMKTDTLNVPKWTAITLSVYGPSTITTIWVPNVVTTITIHRCR